MGVPHQKFVCNEELERAIALVASTAAIYMFAIGIDLNHTRKLRCDSNQQIGASILTLPGAELTTL